MLQLRWTIAATLLALGTLAGCGEPPALTLSESAKTVTSGSGPTTFTATVKGTEGEVTWSLTGPGSISATTGPSTDYTPPATVASSTSATLTATLRDLTASVTITINPPPTITVAGKVVDLYGGPLSDVVVRIGSTDTTSTGEGGVSIGGVSTPYDVAVINGTNKQVTLFKGLTRADPTLMVFDMSPSAPPFKSASLSGTVSGAAGFPQPANHKTVVGFGSTEKVDTNSATANTGTGAFSLNSNWSGPTSTTGTLYALQWQHDESGLPTDYTGYGTKADVLLANGGTFSGQNIALGSGVTEATLTGNVGIPAGYVNSSVALLLTPHPTVFLQLLSQSSPPAGFTYKTPNLSGASLMLIATVQKAGVAASMAWKRGLAPNATDVTLAVPPGPEAILPAPAATGVNYTTPFSWQPYTGGVHMVQFGGGTGQPSFTVLTAGTSATIPDFSSAGLGLPPGATYEWRVMGFGPFADMNAATGQLGYFPGSAASFGRDAGYAVMESRTFTIAP